MNEKNLRPFTSGQSRDKAVRNGRKGGVASGKRRRDKRELYKTLQDLLARPMTDAMGNPVTSPVTGKPMSIIETLATTIIQKAVKGSPQHIRLILDVMGWKAPQRIDANITQTDERSIEEMTIELKRLMRFDALKLDGQQERQFGELLDTLYKTKETEPDGELMAKLFNK